MFAKNHSLQRISHNYSLCSTKELKRILAPSAVVVSRDFDCSSYLCFQINNQHCIAYCNHHFLLLTIFRVRNAGTVGLVLLLFVTSASKLSSADMWLAHGVGWPKNRPEYPHMASPYGLGFSQHGQRGFPTSGPLESQHCERTKWKPQDLF